MSAVRVVVVALAFLASACPRVPAPSTQPPLETKQPGRQPESPTAPPVDRPPPDTEGTVPEVPPPVRP